MFDEQFENAHKRTPPGMAYLTGTGPSGRTCRECERFKVNGYYAASNKHAPNGMKPGRCGKYRELTKQEGAAFPHNTMACKYFVAAEKILAAVWGRK